MADKPTVLDSKWGRLASKGQQLLITYRLSFIQIHRHVLNTTTFEHNKHRETMTLIPFQPTGRCSWKSSYSLLTAVANAMSDCDGRMDGWLGFYGILTTQIAAISCMK